jgi:dTDP-4-amino-4,6-dideoxygalactose transaminase
MAAPIALTDLKALYASQQEKLIQAATRVLASGWYVLGQENERFEQAFAAFCGVGHALGVANGTDAVELALRAVGVGPGDLVATVSHTAVATVSAIERIGATPLLVDVEPASYTMCPQSLQAAFGKAAAGGYGQARIKAVVAVHLYGHCADMRAIGDIASRFDCPVVEDCAQAHGATQHGRKAGSMGRIAAFSFYPTKNLGAFGDGGAVATCDADLASKVRMLRQYGWRSRYESEIPGINSRLDEMQAALLSVRLCALEAENSHRRSLAALYAQELSGLEGLRLPSTAEHCEHVFHLYVVRLAGRDSLAAHLKSQHIGTAIHYPLPVHMQRAYADRIPLAPGGLPQTEALYPEILSLPMHPSLSPEQVRSVCAAIRQWFHADKAAPRS